MSSEADGRAEYAHEMIGENPRMIIRKDEPIHRKAASAGMETPTITLVQRLLAAKRDLRLPQELAQLEKYAIPLYQFFFSIPNSEEFHAQIGREVEF